MASTPTSASALYVVLLANRGNPDYGQDTQRPLPETGHDREWVVGTLACASALCQQYIQTHQLGGGNWAGGMVKHLDGTPVARVAYNGRVFAPDGKTVLQEAANPALHSLHGSEQTANTRSVQRTPSSSSVHTAGL